MKKIYIAPNLMIIKGEPQNIMAGSNPPEDEENFDMGDKWQESGKSTTDADLPISAKGHNAWTSWDD